METDKSRIIAIWKQKEIPVLYRKGKGHLLMVRLPCSLYYRNFIKDGHRISPKWNDKFKCWDTPKAWLTDLVVKILNKHGSLYLIQPYRAQEKCAPACWNAVGYECECSCMGQHHGASNPDGRWFIVSDTFATRWDELELACRLMTSAGASSTARPE